MCPMVQQLDGRSGRRAAPDDTGSPANSSARIAGLDRERGDIRSFRMSRFLSEATDAGEGSEPPEGFDAKEHLRRGPWGVGEPEVEAVVAFSPFNVLRNAMRSRCSDGVALKRGIAEAVSREIVA